jgi:hypothetical protein
MKSGNLSNVNYDEHVENGYSMWPKLNYLHMKRSATILLIALLPAMVYGQKSKIDMGLEGGPSITFQRGNEILSKYNNLRIGFSCGLFFQYNFPKIFSLRSNIAYEQKGSSMSFSTIDTNGNSTVIKGYSNFNYLTIPVLFRSTFGSKVKYFINVGIFAGYLISQKYIYKNEFFPPGNATSQYKPFDFGISGGLGIGIPVNENFVISCELRNNLGLLNIAKGEVYKGGSVKTNSTNLLIGIAYKPGNAQK